jgi:hypothetical protein
MARSISFPSRQFRIRFGLLFAALVFTQIVTVSAFASDPVLDWIAITNDTAISSNPLVTSHALSLVSASVFDAVNGIERDYRPLHVRPDAPGTPPPMRRRCRRPMPSSSGSIPR